MARSKNIDAWEQVKKLYDTGTSPVDIITITKLPRSTVYAICATHVKKSVNDMLSDHEQRLQQLEGKVSG